MEVEYAFMVVARMFNTLTRETIDGNKKMSHALEVIATIFAITKHLP